MPESEREMVSYNGSSYAPWYKYINQHQAVLAVTKLKLKIKEYVLWNVHLSCITSIQIQYLNISAFGAEAY